MNKKNKHEKLLQFVKKLLPEDCLLLKKQNQEDLIKITGLIAPHKLSKDELCKKCQENYDQKYGLSA